MFLPPSRRRLATALLTASFLCAAAGAAQAQTAPAPSESAMVNLVRALVKQGSLSQATGDALIAQAETEAGQAQAARLAAQMPVPPSVQVAATPGAEAGQHVQYVPEIVQDQLRDQVKQELTADARQKGWISPNSLPDWVNRITIGGDFRVRGEGDFYSHANAADFTNINAINTGSPFNIDTATNAFNPSTLNSQKTRAFSNLRFRLALDANITDDIDLHTRLATGSDNQPVTTNQTFGNYFTKDAIWLDRAYADWRPIDGAHIYAGRMANPFRYSDLIWDEDVNPDGVAGSYERALGDRFSAYVTGAVFALGYLSPNTPDTATPPDSKTSIDHDKFISAIQAGGSYKVTDTLTAHLNGDYYYYAKVQGILSPPCDNTADFCATDYSRPGYMQKGNTVFALRDLVALDPANTASPQYFGLASRFQVLEFSGGLDWRPRDDLKVAVSANFAKNLAYSANDVLERGFNPNSGLSQVANNLICTGTLVGGVCPPGDVQFHSGNTAVQVRFSVGTPEIREAGDWGFQALYRYIEPDALLDAFTDQDFHQGGTNAKGFELIGTLGVRHNTNVSLRWFDTDQVYGPRFAEDTVQLDLNLKF